MPGGNCVLYGCCSSGRYNVSLFKIPSLRKDESEYTAAIKLKARQEWINVILQNRTLTPELKERIEKNKVSFCELHFKHDCILENPTRKGLVTGSVPTENLPMFRGRPRELQLFKPPTKKRKLDHEFSKESLENEDLHRNAAMASKNTLPVVNHDENIAPEEGHSPSPDVSKSRRKAPRSQVRKVVRTDLQSKVQEETNVTQPLLAVKSETTSNESFQEPECSERQVQNMVQDVINTTTTCKVLTSPRNENIGIQTVRESGVRAINVTSETTVIEEDYQRKYFHLLNTMNDLQDKFLVSQRNFEDLVKAREAFIEELKGKLESNHREIGSIKQELETSNNKISELEEKRNLYEKKIQNLSVKVEDMKVMEAEVKHQVLKSRGEDELQRTTEKQQEVLEFYKLLTSVTVEKVVEDEKEDCSTVYDKFRCSVKTAQTQELQFLLSYDSEFAEVEYTPLTWDSVDSSFPEYLKEQIFFESAQAPNFLRRLIQTFQKPDEK